MRYIRFFIWMHISSHTVLLFHCFRSTKSKNKKNYLKCGQGYRTNETNQNAHCGQGCWRLHSMCVVLLIAWKSIFYLVTCSFDNLLKSGPRLDLQSPFFSVFFLDFKQLFCIYVVSVFILYFILMLKHVYVHIRTNQQDKFLCKCYLLGNKFFSDCD